MEIYCGWGTRAPTLCVHHDSRPDGVGACAMPIPIPISYDKYVKFQVDGKGKEIYSSPFGPSPALIYSEAVRD